jgi:diacylglycerol kinase family enzyme
LKPINSILVLVNPAAANNTGHSLWGRLIPRFEALFSSYDRKIVETQSAEHNIELATTTDADLIISVSGDGTVHDIVQGIMRRPREERPALTMVPIGTGNDIARTLNIPLNPQRALEAISTGRPVATDVGRCNDTFFLETLSFGIDAAIALKTVEMRKTIKTRGFLIYVRAAISAILHELKSHHFTITADGARAGGDGLSDEKGGTANDAGGIAGGVGNATTSVTDGTIIDENLLICAIQNGPTYGGGFRITPNAHASDGMLNVCMATDINRLYALYVLSLVARGKHEHLPIVRSLTARRMTVDLDQELPAQCDGERLRGTHFEIELIPGAIDTLIPRSTPRSTAL